MGGQQTAAIGKDPRGEGGAGGRGPSGRKAAVDPKAQRNFTDPDSRIMGKSGKEYVQAYNAQAAVDATAQVIVAQSLGNSATDVQQLEPIVQQIKVNTGRQANEFSADAGYCSEGNLAVLARHHIHAYIATGRQQHAQASATGRRRAQGPRAAAMRQAGPGRPAQSLPIAKDSARAGVRPNQAGQRVPAVLVARVEKVQGEWSLICTVHNLLKLAKAMKNP